MRWFLWFTLAAFLFLSACSDSSSANDSEQVATDGVYPTEDDLPNCTSKLEGDSAYVEEDDAFYVCSGKSWNLVAESSSSVETKKEGLSSEKETSSSSVDKIESASSSSIEEDSEAVATSIEGVNGYMQKGPFLSGSKVRVLELESGRTLRQTGRNFETVIQTDDGKFALNAQTMVSQYIELHAEGFYRNEVTGTESEAPISLYAITDVSKRDHGLVNINLLTHLEYQRVVYLVKEKKMRVAAAKDSAQKEVLAMLGITNNKGFGSSEDLNVVGSTDADGALLAFSVLFQGNRTEAQLTSLLQGVVSDLKEDGKWDDEDTKTAIADWAEAQDRGGKLTTIRGHVAAWKLGSVPNFEKYVRNFWYSNYGLGGCSSANEGKVAKNKNTNSKNKDDYFICKSDAWQVATEIEKDTYDYENNKPWTNGTMGDKKTGSVSRNVYIFDGEWRLAITPEINYGLCYSANEGDNSNDGTYTCVNGAWIKVIIDDFEDGDVVVQDIDNAYWYVSTSGGSSLSNTRNEELGYYWEMIFMDGTNHYAALMGISGITPGSNLYDPPVYGFVLLGFDAFVGAFASCTAIQYDYKGSGHYMRGLVDGVTPDKGYDHYSEVQDKSETWKTVTISTMEQPAWVSSGKPSEVRPFSWEKIKRINWLVDQSISSENLGTELAIDNVKCIR